MADAQASQAAVLAEGDVSVFPQVSQARVFGEINFPAEFTQVSQASVVATVKFRPTADVSQARVYAEGRGRIENRRLRAWGFPLDSHDIFVLRLGEDATLIYDLSTDQWADWAGHDLPFWRAHLGCEWAAMGAELLAQGHTTTIVAGDDTYGLLWTLAPEAGIDESPRTDRPDASFERIVTGGIPMRGRGTARCNFVYLTGSLGAPALTGAEVRLRTSDDDGHSWADHGALTVQPGDWGQKLTWSGLGLIASPGRIFEFRDDGALARVDGADME